MSRIGIEGAFRAGMLATVLTASACSPFNSELPSTGAVTKTAAELTPTAPAREIPIFEQLDRKVLDRLRPDIVTVSRVVKKGYDVHGIVDSSCSGFIVRDRDEYYAATARHCLPEIITSKKDGQPYLAKGKDSRSIYNVGVIGPNKISFTGDSIKYLSGSENDNSKDLALVQVPEKVGGDGIPLNVGEIKPNDTYYLLRIINEEVIAFPIHSWNKFSDGGNWFIDLNSGLSCIPGSSGSAVVNSVGELVSLVSSASTIELQPQDISRYNLSPIHTGRIVTACFGVPSSRVLELIRN